MNQGEKGGPEVSIDLETLDVVGSKKRMPVILSIGAAAFDPNVVAPIEDFIGSQEKFAEQLASGKAFADYGKYYSPVSLAESLRHGFTTDPGTIKWWQKKPFNQIAESAAYTDRIEETLEDFAKWLKHVKPTKVWANAPTFDCVILRETFDYFGLKGFDIEFRAERDVRTALDFFSMKWIEIPQGLVHHHALCDAITEAMMIQRIYARRNELLEIERKYRALENEQAQILATGSASIDTKQ